jgi:cytochrome c oxidase assembly factor CtaG/putative copper export protein
VVTRWNVTRLGLLGVAGVAAVVVALLVSGAADGVVLGDPGPLVRWGLPVTETLVELAAALTLGSLVLAVGILPRRADLGGSVGTPDPARARRAARRGAAAVDGRAYPAVLTLAGAAAAAWTALGVVQLVLTYASVAGRPIGGPTFGSELGLFIGQVSLGRTLIGITIVAALTSALALLVATPTGAAWTALVALVALVLQSQTGHAAGASNHELAVSSLFLHLVGAAVWIGALAALAVLNRRLGADVGPAVARYSPVAGWCFAAVALSGTVNAAIRLGGWDGLSTVYGLLIVAKVVLFVLLGAIGWAYRRSVIPRLTAPGGERAVGATGLLWRLVAAELVLMGLVSGVAVALSSTAPPVPDERFTDPTPAEIVSGHPLPPEPVGSAWWTEWRWDVLLAAGCVAGVVVYLRWVLRLRRRGDAWPWGRTASWVTGMALVFWATSGSLATYGHVLFSVHMVQHMVLAMVAPILLALAAPVTLALRALPARGDDSRGPREWILTLVNSHVAQFLSLPLVAAANFAGSMVVFYYTGLFELSLRHYLGHLGMVVHFTVAGYLFVNALVGVDPAPHRPAYPQRLLMLLGTMAFHAFFGVTLMSGEVLLVADWFGVLGRDWGPSALEDQQRGGAIAWGIGEAPTIALAIIVALSWSRDDERVARRRDRKVDRDGDVEMDEYNAMLARLAGDDRRAATRSRD